MTRAGRILLIILAAAGACRPAQAQEFKVGIVSFLSGQAADSFGVPAVKPSLASSPAAVQRTRATL